jgi:hypothetical protein
MGAGCTVYLCLCRHLHHFCTPKQESKAQDTFIHAYMHTCIHAYMHTNYTRDIHTSPWLHSIPFDRCSTHNVPSLMIICREPLLVVQQLPTSCPSLSHSLSLSLPLSPSLSLSRAWHKIVQTVHLLISDMITDRTNAGTKVRRQSCLSAFANPHAIPKTRGKNTKKHTSHSHHITSHRTHPQCIWK